MNPDLSRPTVVAVNRPTMLSAAATLGPGALAAACHTGELPGYQAFTGYDPDTKRSLVVISNLNSAPDGRAVSATIAQALIAGIYR